MRTTRRSLRWPRRRLAMLAAGLVVASTLTVPIGGEPALAAAAIDCQPTASVFAADATGKLLLYSYNSPATDSISWTGPRTIGTGWGMYGRIIGGADGRLYGINASGLYRYRWLGTTWDSANGTERTQLSTGFTEYASGPLSPKITVDEAGDIYTIDAKGGLRWSRYDESGHSWSAFQQLLSVDGGQYNLIVAGSAGVLYGRTSDGRLIRHRFDATSQRWIGQPAQVGTGWNIFTKIFSIGGDNLFGITANGDLLRYRYQEADNSWPLGGRVVGTGWQNFPNVAATTNSCRLTGSYTPDRPPFQMHAFSPVAMRQEPTQLGQPPAPIDFAYSANNGDLVHTRQSAENSTPTTWSVVATDSSYFDGTPALVSDGQGRVTVMARAGTSNVSELIQSAPGSTGWNPKLDLGGRMASNPSVVRLNYGPLVAFAIDGAGALWYRASDGPDGELQAWRSLGGSGLTGNPMAVANGDAADIVVMGPNGTPQVATYRSGALSAWTSLGGSGFTGSPSVAPMPGGKLYVFASNADGQIVMQAEQDQGGFPGVWQPVGSFTANGSPAAILDPVLGRVVVVARGADNELYRAVETGMASLAWGDWARVNPDSSDPAGGDPSVAPFRTSTGDSWLIAFRSPVDKVRLYERIPVPGNGGNPESAGVFRTRAS